MTKKATLTQAEIERRLKAMRAVYGENGIAAVDFTPDGGLRVLPGEPGAVVAFARKDGAEDGWEDVRAA